MLLSELAETSAKLSRTAGRIEKVRCLAETIRLLSPQEIDIGINYLTGMLRQARHPSAPKRAV